MKGSVSAPAIGSQWKAAIVWMSLEWCAFVESRLSAPGLSDESPNSRAYPGLMGVRQQKAPEELYFID